MKSLNNLLKEEQEIIGTLIREGWVTQKVNRRTIIELHKRWKDKVESVENLKDFVELIGGKWSEFEALYKHKGISILKQYIRVATVEERASKIKELEQEGRVGEEITYVQFQKLYHSYGFNELFTLEEDFANFLQIGITRFYNIKKNPKESTVILRRYAKEQEGRQTEEELGKLRESLPLKLKELEVLFSTLELSEEIRGIISNKLRRAKETKNLLKKRDIINKIEELFRDREEVLMNIEYPEDLEEFALIALKKIKYGMFGKREQEHLKKIYGQYGDAKKDSPIVNIFLTKYLCFGAQIHLKRNELGAAQTSIQRCEAILEQKKDILQDNTQDIIEINKLIVSIKSDISKALIGKKEAKGIHAKEPRNKLFDTIMSEYGNGVSPEQIARTQGFSLKRINEITGRHNLKPNDYEK